LINGWYAGNRSTQDVSFVPAGWQDATTTDTKLPDFYKQVVGKSCRTCHIAFLPFEDFTSFSNFAGLKPMISDYVFDTGSSGIKVMPHANVTSKNFWNGGVANKLATFSYTPATTSPPTSLGTTWSAINPPSSAVSGVVGGGAGIEVVGGSGVEVTGSTIAFNTIHAGANEATPTDATNGAGIRVDIFQTATIRSSIIANNFVNLAGYSLNDFKINVINGVGNGTIASQDFNLIGTLNGIGGTLTGTTTHNILKLDPNLGPLAYNSLSTNPLATLTLELLDNSPAINKGDNSITLAPLSLTTDQRGQPRKFGSAVDIGAFETASSVASGGGARDMNGDGYADLLFQHTYGYIAAWTMDGKGTPNGNISIYSGTGLAGWRLAAVADVNGDGNADLIFQHTSGYIAAWTMDGKGAPNGNISIYSGAGLAGWLAQ